MDQMDAVALFDDSAEESGEDSAEDFDTEAFLEDLDMESLREEPDSEESDAELDDDVPLQVLLARLEDSQGGVRYNALMALSQRSPVAVAQHTRSVIARLEDHLWKVRQAAIITLGRLEPATFAQHADFVIVRLADPQWEVRAQALYTLRRLDEKPLAQHAGAVVGRLEDSKREVRFEALATLGKLEPAKLARHADVLMARLEDPNESIRTLSYGMLMMLPERATFRYKVYAEFARFNAATFKLAATKAALLCILPRFVTREVDIDSDHQLRSQLLGRLAWYRFRLRRRVKCLALYWYALPYRPSGPGHARDVAEWGQMRELRSP